ncbi:MAG: nucleotidyltransferase domain-containing protein [Cyanobacteria bacterium J06629_19]
MRNLDIRWVQRYSSLENVYLLLSAALTDSYGLLAQDLFHICAAAAEIPEIEEVILFGSCAKGTYQQGSDVDLSIKGENITHTTVFRLSDELNEERPLPYFFDVVDYNSLENDEPLRSHIDRVGKVLFTRPKVLVGVDANQ